MDEIKRITRAFEDKAAGAGSIETIWCDLNNVEKAFQECNDELSAVGMPDCSYIFQEGEIQEMTENLRILLTYVQNAHAYVSEVLDFPFFTDFSNNATESLSHIILDDISTDNTFNMEEYVEVNDAGYLYMDKQVKKELKFSDFLGIQEITPKDGYPVLENVETVGEFASLFRADYDKMKPEGKDINTFLNDYLSYGEFEHTGYHPVKDFLSGLADMTIIIPVIDCIIGKDIITGETLNDFQRGMKLAGATVDLFTLGQAMTLAGGAKAGAKVIAKTLAIEMVSNAAGYSVGYAGDAIGMPTAVTWVLSVVTGCTVSATMGGYLFKSPDGSVRECTAEEAEELIRNIDVSDTKGLTDINSLNGREDVLKNKHEVRIIENLAENGGKSGSKTINNVSKASPYDLQATHSQTLSKKNMNKLIDDIKNNGISETIKYVEHNGQKYVVDGHHRLIAAKRLGLEQVPIEQVELPYAGYKTIEDLLWFD